MSSPTNLSKTSTPKSQPKLKPKQASRSVSNLTPDQLQRKRAQDRENQRQTRQVKPDTGPLKNRGLTTHRLRVKDTIADLEKKVEELTENLQRVRLENASLQNAPTAPPTIPLPQPISDPGNLSYQAMDMGSMDMVGQHDNEDQYGWIEGQYGWIEGQYGWIEGQYGWIDMRSMDMVGQHGNEEYQYGSMSDNSGTVPLSSSPVWEVGPIHSDLSVMVRATKYALELSNNLEDLFLSALLDPRSDPSQVPLVGEVASVS